MNIQQQSLQNSRTPFSSASIQTIGKRRPRFQRQKSNQKCNCHSTSKNKSSCDSFSLSSFYVKKSFIKPSTPEKNPNIQRDQLIFANLQENLSHSEKKNLDSTRIQNKNDSQLFLEKSQIHKIDTNQILIQDFLISSESPDQNRKQTEALLKKSIFYKQKCEKYQSNMRSIKIEKSRLDNEVKMLGQENQRLKTQIKHLKRIINDCLGQNSEIITPTKRFQNKNLAKLKQEYQKFRSQEEFSTKSYEKKYLQAQSELKQTKLETDKLRHDLVRQNQLYNLKLKMMQEKEEFLEKTLSFTKNVLNQLQKDYQEKQGEILESKRFHDIINDKNKEIQIFKHKYQNIVKILNGQKKRASTFKVQHDQTQKLTIPACSKSRHSLEVKTIVYNHKQKGEINCTIKTNIIEKSKLVQNPIEAKIHNKKTSFKENYQVSELKKGIKNKSPILDENFQQQQYINNVSDDKKINDSSSDLTLFSSNSLELSPQKSQK